MFPRSILCGLALGALALVALPALAQKNKNAKAPTVSAIITTGPRGEAFVLGPDDVISVVVARHPEMSANALLLSATGRVVLPVVGPITVGGKTLAQAQTAITAAFATRLRVPKVAVALVRARPRQATVLGAVTRPGAVNLRPGWRVSEVLAAAGGLAGLAPSDVKATLQRAGAAPVALDLAAIARAPENVANARVNVGDVITIAPIPLVKVTINGDVATPGPQKSRAVPRLLDALKRAGGLKIAPADSEVTLLRDAKIIALDVRSAIQNPAGPANIALRDGDLLSVQGVRLNIKVIAEGNLVKSPGNYQLDGRSQFTGAIMAAGGLNLPAKGVLASLQRGSKILPVDLERAFYDSKADIKLQNNDIILLKPLQGVRARLSGAVKTPGSYTLKSGENVLGAVIDAGDLSVPPAEANITILRDLPGGQQIALRIDAARLWLQGDLSQNAPLRDGDLILVNPINAPGFAVAGEVARPDFYEMEPDENLAQLLARAGGATPLAALSRITIYRRNDAVEVVDYSNGRDGGAVPPVILQAGDRVQVPTNPRQILVMNAVAQPGKYAIPDGQTLTLSDALKLAGATQSGSKPREVALLRRALVSPETPDGYSTRVVPLDGNSGHVAGADDLPLIPGDVIFVSEGKVTPAELQKASMVARIVGLT